MKMSPKSAIPTSCSAAASLSTVAAIKGSSVTLSPDKSMSAGLFSVAAAPMTLLSIFSSATVVFTLSFAIFVPTLAALMPLFAASPLISAIADD